MFRLLLLVGFLSVTGVFADEVAKTEEEEVAARKARAAGHSFAPVIGYEPVYSFVFGAAYFYETPNFQGGIDVNTNFSRVYQAHINVRHELSPYWFYVLKTGITRGFDPYFGEGGETDVSAFRRIWGLKQESRAQISYQVNKLLAVGLFGDYRSRTEVKENDTAPFTRIFPDEDTVGLGVNLIVDSRINKSNPRNGFMFSLDGTYVPGKFSSLKAQGDFGQIEGNFTVQHEILDEILPGVVAAFQISGGYSIGNPSYTFRYRLGSANRLRGYYENRFRGKMYYMQQTEIRIPIWKLFGGALFAGFGDAADDKFTNAKLAYGVGLRIGLPPDWISKLRIDFAIGRDQQGVFANFGHTF